MAEKKSPSSNPHSAYSDELDTVREALDVLYIPKNASGRNKFREKYPDVALYLFEEELIGYDLEGSGDWDRKAELEDAADHRRIMLKNVMDEVPLKTSDSGVLQQEYVGGVLDEYGVLIAPYLYSDSVIGRVRPDMLTAIKARRDGGDDAEQENAPSIPPADQPLSAEEKQLLSNADRDDHSLSPLVKESPNPDMVLDVEERDDTTVLETLKAPEPYEEKPNADQTATPVGQDAEKTVAPNALSDHEQHTTDAPVTETLKPAQSNTQSAGGETAKEQSSQSDTLQDSQKPQMADAPKSADDATVAKPQDSVGEAKDNKQDAGGEVAPQSDTLQTSNKKDASESSPDTPKTLEEQMMDKSFFDDVKPIEIGMDDKKPPPGYCKNAFNAVAQVRSDP